MVAPGVQTTGQNPAYRPSCYREPSAGWWALGFEADLAPIFDSLGDIVRLEVSAGAYKKSALRATERIIMEIMLQAK